ncbi:MAG: T9SS type A sorting domain-containing protein, partial [Bacteroidia bacterium]|nr:T9SS type A sorting domain-containing protein [Bacteroidia bacterium]
TAYRTDVAFQTNISGLCPETYYEVSAWIKNICSKCGCDSNGVGATGGGYIPTASGDSSGVRPNLAFQINSIDYYTTGDLVYQGLGSTQAATDTLNKWVKKAFVYKTQPNETSFAVSFRNNAPGGGGNDWAIDDIGIRTCEPTMKYSPSLIPSVCNANTLTLYDTIKSTYNNYTTYKWQRSTNGGATWADITGTLGPSSPTWNGTEWQYITNYVIPPAQTTLPHNGDKYRMIVATTVANISNANCLYSDPTNTVTLDVLDCGIPLSTELLSFNGKIITNHANLSWSTSKEDNPIHFDIERSADGITFIKKGEVTSSANYSSEVNYYSFIDPENFTGKVWYRIVMINNSGRKKYSQIIQFNEGQINFGLGNVINPFKDELVFEVLTSANSKIDVSLIDLFGKTLRYKSFAAYSGVNSLKIENTQSLKPGIYILQVKNGNTTFNNKVLKR